jgi:hypothetical protein
VNGDVVCKLCGGIYPFSVLRPHLTESQFARWNNAMMVVQKRELESKHRQEIARLKNASELNRLVDHIRECILFDACPRCHSRFEYTGGCMALSCPVCKCEFCGHCFKDCGDDAHEHASNCEFNRMKGNVFLAGKDKLQAYATVQIARKKRLLQQYLSSIGSIDLRAQVKALLNDRDKMVRDAFHSSMNENPCTFSS